MPEYKFSVVDQKGRPITGTIKADNLDACKKIIEQRGHFIVGVTPASIVSKDLSFGVAKYKTKDLSVFCRQFSAMLNSGIGIIKILDILQQQQENKVLKAIIRSVYESVQKGQDLSSALKEQGDAFPEMMINMVSAGEASGSLDKVMEKIAEHYEKTLKTDNKIKSAMMYPMVLGIIIVVVVVFLIVFVIPTFVDLFGDNPLPWPTKVVVGLSDSIGNYWYVYLLAIGAISTAWMLFIRNENGKLAYDKFKTSAPVIGKLNKTIVAARFARTLATMISSGIPLVKSLELTAKVMSNSYYEQGVKQVAEDIKKGSSLSSSLKKIKMFPMMLLSMIMIGEESGSLDGVLAKTANFYDEESDRAISTLVGLLEPLMIVIMAVVVGFIVIAILLPMYGSMQMAG